MWMFLAFTAVSAVSVLVPIASGRRQRRELKAAVAAAVHQDEERRRRSAPSAADLAARGMSKDLRQSTNESGPVWLRLGLAEQAANIRLEPADAGFRPPPLGLMPLTLDPSASLTTIRGPNAAVAGLVRYIIMQLAGYPAARRTGVLVHGSPDSVPLASRFLSCVTLSGNAAATADYLRAGPGSRYDRGLLIVLDDADTALRLSALASSNGWQVIDCSAGTYPAGSVRIVLGERTARLTTGPE
jgi:S-DNA-T family DNA segregation ATPase FtsK/SpoIIIE